MAMNLDGGYLHIVEHHVDGSLEGVVGGIPVRQSPPKDQDGGTSSTSPKATNSRHERISTPHFGARQKFEIKRVVRKRSATVRSRCKKVWRSCRTFFGLRGGRGGLSVDIRLSAGIMREEMRGNGEFMCSFLDAEKLQIFSRRGQDFQKYYSRCNYLLTIKVGDRCSGPDESKWESGSETKRSVWNHQHTAILFAPCDRPKHPPRCLWGNRGERGKM